MPDSSVIDFQPESPSIDFEPEQTGPPTLGARRGTSSSVPVVSQPEPSIWQSIAEKQVPSASRYTGAEGAFTTGRGAVAARDIAGAARTIATPPAPATLPSPLAARAGAPVPPQPGDVGLPGRQASVAKGVEGAFTLGSPVMAAAGIANPLPAVEGLILGYGASKAGKYGVKAAGGGPEAQRLGEDIGWLAAPGRMLDPRAGLDISPEGVRGAFDVLGGRAGVGAAVTPEQVAFRGKVGPFQGEISIPRGGAAKPALEPPTIEGTPITRAEASEYLERTNYDPDAARALAAKERAAKPATQTPVAPPVVQPVASQPKVPAPTGGLPAGSPPSGRAGAVSGGGTAPAAKIDFKPEEVEVAKAEAPKKSTAVQGEVLPPSTPLPKARVEKIVTPESVTPKSVVTQPASEPTQKAEEAKYKFGSTQANIPPDSEAAKALSQARDRIPESDLAGKGKETEPHVTVKYGIQGEDTDGIRKHLASLEPFEASLGKTDVFPPSEHSDGAAVVMAPIEAPELHKINAEAREAWRLHEVRLRIQTPRNYLLRKAGSIRPLQRHELNGG